MSLTYICEGGVTLSNLPDDELEWILDRLERVSKPYCVVIVEDSDPKNFHAYGVYEKTPEELEEDNSTWASWYATPGYFKNMIIKELESRKALA